MCNQLDSQAFDFVDFTDHINRHVQKFKAIVWMLGNIEDSLDPGDCCNLSVLIEGLISDLERRSQAEYEAWRAQHKPRGFDIDAIHRLHDLAEKRKSEKNREGATE